MPAAAVAAHLVSGIRIAARTRPLFVDLLAHQAERIAAFQASAEALRGVGSFRPGSIGNSHLAIFVAFFIPCSCVRFRRAIAHCRQQRLPCAVEPGLKHAPPVRCVNLRARSKILIAGCVPLAFHQGPLCFVHCSVLSSYQPAAEPIAQRDRPQRSSLFNRQCWPAL